MDWNAFMIRGGIVLVAGLAAVVYLAARPKSPADPLPGSYWSTEGIQYFPPGPEFMPQPPPVPSVPRNFLEDLSAPVPRQDLTTSPDEETDDVARSSDATSDGSVRLAKRGRP